jgi:aryl-alcohol dehydrogenase-like predicted oxidoreductase
VEKRRLGKGGPEVSAIGLGCMAMSEFYGESDDENSKKVILEALESGITMLDTADTYGFGHNESLIADALKDWSGDILYFLRIGSPQGVREKIPQRKALSGHFPP